MFDHTPKLQRTPDRANSNQIGDLLSFSHISEFDNNWYPFTLWPKVPYGVWGIFQKNWAGLVYKGFVKFSSFFPLDVPLMMGLQYWDGYNFNLPDSLWYVNGRMVLSNRRWLRSVCVWWETFHSAEINLRHNLELKFALYSWTSQTNCCPKDYTSVFGMTKNIKIIFSQFAVGQKNLATSRLVAWWYELCSVVPITWHGRTHTLVVDIWDIMTFQDEPKTAWRLEFTLLFY